MKTVDLISQLTKDNKPVKVIKFTPKDFLKVFLSGVFCVMVAVLIIGLRDDIHYQIKDPYYLLEIFGFLLIALLCVLSAFSLSIPDQHSRLRYFLPILTFLFLSVVSLRSLFLFDNNFDHSSTGLLCLYEVIGISVLPAIVLTLFVRKAAILNRVGVGMLVFTASASFGLIGVNLTCQENSPFHLLLWHFLPAALVISSGYFIARKYLIKI